MGENERRRGYGWNRVLIESARILDPQFDDAVVYLSGAQIELLRNVTQYLNRLGTYVAEYNPGYYLVPTDEDFDDILEIVADMEETLMGNPNTIWGYSEIWSQEEEETSTGAASTYVYTTPPPEGEVYVLENWRLRHYGGATMAVELTAVIDGVPVLLYDVPALPHAEDVYKDTRITLDESCYLQLRVYALPNTKVAELTVSGYKMVVPTD